MTLQGDAFDRLESRARDMADMAEARFRAEGL
jgi:hypothetical protein